MAKRRRTVLATCIALAILDPGLGHAVERWGGLVTVTSEYVFRGISQSGGEPAVQADLHAEWPNGWYVGAWATTADPPPGDVATYEINLYGGRSFDLTDSWSAAMTYARYLYPDSRPAGRYDSDEFVASVHFEDRATLAISYSPNSDLYSRYGYVYQGHTLSYEASLRQPIAGRFALLASLGHYDTSAVLGRSYWAGSCGLAVTAGAFDVSITRFAADSAARELFGEYSADDTWVATVTWRFSTD